MAGLEFDPALAVLEILYGGRTAYQLGAQMVEMLTATETFSAVSVAFADLTKDNLIYWQGTSDFVNFPPTVHNAETSTSFITAVPQESDVTQDLMDVPAGADFFAGQIKLSRTTAPASTWMTRTIPVLPPQAQWLPFLGGLSLPLEAEFGLYRMMHLYIDAGAGKLRIAREQSVSVQPAGCQQPSQRTTAGTVDSWWHVTVGSVEGIPVFTRANVATGNYNNGGGVTHIADRGGGSQPAINDTTNYASTYTVDIQGRFGRRS